MFKPASAWPLFGLGVLLFLGFGRTASAQETDDEETMQAYLDRKPEDLLARASQEIKEGRYTDALDTLDDVTILDEKNAEAYFLIGQLHVEHFVPAIGIENLERCRALAPDHKGLYLLLGKAHIELGHLPEAVEALSRERTLSGDSPEIAFQLGLAFCGQKKWAEAEAEMRRIPPAGDPYSGRAHFNLALIAGARNDEVAVAAEFRQAVETEMEADRRKAYQGRLATVDEGKQSYGQLAQGTLRIREAITTGTLAELVAKAPPPRPRPTFSGTAQFSFEWDDNVPLVEDELLPLNVSEEQDVRGVVNGSLEWVPLQEGAWELGSRVSFYQSGHFEEDELDYTQGRIAVFGAWKSGTLRLELAPYFSGSALHGQEYEDIRGVVASALWRPVDWGVTSFSYRFGSRDVILGSGSDAGDRDGEVHELSLSETILPKDSIFTFRVGVNIELQRTEGDDYNRDAWTPWIEVGCRLPADFHLGVTYAHRFEEYLDDNSVSGFTEERDDDRDSVTVRVERPMSSWLTAFVEYRHLDNDSNIEPFEFQDNVVGGGVLIRY